MKLSKAHKRYGAVLGFCLAAFAVDRAFLSPGQAAASPTPGAGEPEVTSQVPVSAAQTAETHESIDLASPETVVAHSLQSIASTLALDANEVSDAFRLPADWAPKIEVAVEDVSGLRPAEAFVRRHVLTGTMASGAGGYAIVDGNLLHIGASLDGFTLVTVEERAAYFTSEKDEVVLALQTPLTVDGPEIRK